ncbi:MAG: hypothetical protein NVS2B3_14550 [Vulcanimicrobiaceae bacterium]
MTAIRAMAIATLMALCAPAAALAAQTPATSLERAAEGSGARCQAALNEKAFAAAATACKSTADRYGAIAATETGSAADDTRASQVGYLALSAYANSGRATKPLGVSQYRAARAIRDRIRDASAKAAATTALERVVGPGGF